MEEGVKILFVVVPRMKMKCVDVSATVTCVIHVLIDNFHYMNKSLLLDVNLFLVVIERNL